MTRENVETVRASWEAWERGDMDALFDLYDPAQVQVFLERRAALDAAGLAE